MTFVLLYGPPAVGKLTVATELAKLTGFKVFHNHLSIDLAETLFERGTPSFGHTVHGIRQLIFEEAARGGVDLIFTYVYAYPQDDPKMQWMLEAVEKHGAKTLLVQLTCAPEKLTERVGSDSRRSSGKITDAGVLEQLLTTYDLLTPYPASPSLQLDTTDAPPAKTAAAIAAHIQKESYADR